MGAVRTFSKHAFGLRTVAPIATSAFSAWVGLGQMHMSIDDPDFWILMVAGLGLGLLSWGAVAFDSWKRDKEAEALKATLNEVAHILKRDEGRTPEHLQNWAGASNSQLKREIDAICKDIISFSEALGSARAKEVSRQFFAADPPGVVAQSEERMRQRIELHEKYQRLFAERLRPKALALRNEARQRLGIIDPPIDLANFALDTGQLAGANPLDDTIKGLSELAQKLRD